MNVVQDLLLEKLLNSLDEIIFRGKVKINGEYKSYDVFRTIREGNVLRKYLYLDTEIGLVEEAQLITDTGDILAIKPFNIQKHEDGLVLAFEFTIEVREG